MTRKLPWLICGSAACVCQDIAAAPAYGQVIALNDMIGELTWTPDLGVVGHWDLAPRFVRAGVPIVSWSAGPAVDTVIPVPEGWHGTSALYAVAVAMELGASSVILAGCPIDGGPRFDGLCSLVGDLEFYRSCWHHAFPTIHGRVFSLSGWTRDLLGAPK